MIVWSSIINHSYKYFIKINSFFAGVKWEISIPPNPDLPPLPRRCYSTDCAKAVNTIFILHFWLCFLVVECLCTVGCSVCFLRIISILPIPIYSRNWFNNGGISIKVLLQLFTGHICFAAASHIVLIGITNIFTLPKRWTPVILCDE